MEKSFKWNKWLFYFNFIFWLVWNCFFVGSLILLVKAINLIINFDFRKIFQSIMKILNFDYNQLFAILGIWIWLTFVLIILTSFLWFHSNQIRFAANNLKSLNFNYFLYYKKIEQRMQWTNVIMTFNFILFFFPLIVQFYKLQRVKKDYQKNKF